MMPSRRTCVSSATLPLMGPIRACRPGALLAKADIQSAFRLLPIHPEDFDLLGIEYGGRWYVDKTMPMGCSIACAAFEAFSSFLEWAVRRRGRFREITHFLDDFLIAGRGGTDSCARRLGVFQAVAAELGVPLAQDKTEGPATQLTYLGIQLDSVAGTSSLPLEKVRALSGLLGEMSERRKCTLKEMQVLLGHLNFVCKVVAPGRAFCARLAHATRGLSKPHHRMRISHGIREDLRTWQEFIGHFNGVSLWQEDIRLRGDLQVHSDAAGGAGFGVLYRDRWCAKQWPAWWGAELLRDLTFLEFFPLVVAVVLWREEFRNKRVLFWCDNQAAVRILNKQTAKSARIMCLVRRLVLVGLEANITFRARHVAGVNNVFADSLSRLQVRKFHMLAPQARRDPDDFPDAFWDLRAD
ncbi:uncharacterized protein LOC143832292 [Paroedura picta]|uniref:uncharacterized protein LOC143832292 n=1 Tax=Paroedura picta TaxID=143630 RepID=UPI0040563B9F